MKSFIQLMLLISMLYSSVTSAQETSRDKIDDLIYNSINAMLSDYSWWWPPALYYDSGCLNGSCGQQCSSSYCPSNKTIVIPYFDVRLFYKFGDAAVAFVICHEMAHHIQNLMRKRYGRKLSGESEADCAAGALMGSLVRNNYIVLNNTDGSEMEKLAWEIGDYCGGSPHGTPSQRVNALRRGCDLGMKHKFEYSFRVCIKEFD